jgi:ABC-type sugar transport system ATPase subunit
MISSELPEILGMNDRTVVMREGRVVAILDHTQATQELVAAYALGTINNVTPPTMEEKI